jgi:hypothetical protein
MVVKEVRSQEPGVRRRGRHGDTETQRHREKADK